MSQESAHLDDSGVSSSSSTFSSPLLLPPSSAMNRVVDFSPAHSPGSSGYYKCFYEDGLFGDVDNGYATTASPSQPQQQHDPAVKKEPTEDNSDLVYQSEGPMLFSSGAHSSQPSPLSVSTVIPDSTSFLPHSAPPLPKNFNCFQDRRVSDSVVYEDPPSHPMKSCFPFEQPLRSHSVGEYSPFLQPDGKNDGSYLHAASVPPDSSGAASGSNGANGSQKAFVPCKVCGDKASGYHYGVTSCEGCKGFFRRSIQKQIEYRCLRDGKCMVFRLNRNRCQYCRFKKCLAVGMSRDSVRYGRVPKRSRERMAEDSRVSSMTGDSGEAESEVEKKQLALYDIILSVSQAHHSNCNYTDDKIKNLAQRPLHFPMVEQGENEALSSTDLLEQQKILMWETMAQYTTPEIQRVVEFAKRIPGFTDLVQEDQLCLIKAGFFEVWLVRIARMFNPQHFAVTFFDGSFIVKDQLELIYNNELVSAMFNFSVNFNNLHLNDGEIGLFTAVVLLTQDRTGLSDTKMVEQLQEKLIEAIKLQLSRSHSSDPQVFPNLLMKLTELRTVGTKHQEVLGWYRMNWRRLKLPPLYAEIYDIQKCEEPLPPVVSNGTHPDEIISPHLYPPPTNNEFALA